MKYPLLVFIAGFMVCGRLYCQNQHVVDSLTEAINRSEGAEKYTAWHKLVLEYIDHDNEKALDLITGAEAAALCSRDSTLILRSKRLRGQILFRLGKPQAVIQLLEPLTVNSHLKKAGEEYLNVTNLIGVSYMVMSQFDRGLDYLFLARESAKRNNNGYYMATTATNIGLIYYKLKDYDKALPFMISAYQKEDSLGILGFSTPMNISLCYANLRQYALAQKFLQKSINKCGGGCDSQALLHIKYASGYVLYGLHEYKKAEAEFLASLKLSRRVRDRRMELDNIYLLAKISMERNDLREAEHYLRAADHLFEKEVPFNMEAIKVYSELSELYLRLRKFERASFYQSRYIELRDSIYNEALMTNLMKIESNYLQRENEAKIDMQGEIIELKEKMLARQKVLNVVVVAFSLTLLAFLVLLVERYRAKKRSNLSLEQKVGERTRDLYSMVGRLSILIKEKDMQIDKAASEYIHSIRSVQTLCDMAQTEVTDQVAQTYLRKISERLKPA